MTTIMGFMILQEDGTPIFSHHRDSMKEIDESLLPSLLVVTQMFAKGMSSSPDSTGIKSITLTDIVYTISNFDLQTPSRKENRYYFVLLSDNAKKSSDLDAVLEYIVVNFFCFNNGEFVVKLRIQATGKDEFDEFTSFLESVMKSRFRDLVNAKKTPPACSFVQGLLNEMSQYISVEQMVSWNQKLIPLGRSYVWLSDDLTKKEETEILEKIKENLSEALYNTITERVQGQL